MKLVCSGTSIPSRIDKVSQVIQALLSQTYQPDLIYLNLSREEFDGIDIPSDLIDLAHGNNQFIINWVENNTYTYKKFLPIYNNHLDSFIFSFDDDIVYLPNTLECFIRTYQKYGGKYNITYSQILVDLEFGVLGRGMLYKPGVLNEWEYFLTDELIEHKHDDLFYENILRIRNQLITAVEGLDISKAKTFIYESSWVNDLHEVPGKFEFMNNQLVRFYQIQTALNLIKDNVPLYGNPIGEFIKLNKYELK